MGLDSDRSRWRVPVHAVLRRPGSACTNSRARPAPRCVCRYGTSFAAVDAVSAAQRVCILDIDIQVRRSV